MGFLDKLFGKTKDAASDVADKAAPVVDRATDKTGDLGEQAADKASDLIDRAKDAGQDDVPPASSSQIL
jgi:hypothetical protein